MRGFNPLAPFLLPMLCCSVLTFGLIHSVLLCSQENLYIILYQLGMIINFLIEVSLSEPHTSKEFVG